MQQQDSVPTTPRTPTSQPLFSDDEDDIEFTVVPNTFAIEGKSVVITLDDDEDIEKLCKEIANTRYAKKIGLKRAGERILGNSNKKLKFTPKRLENASPSPKKTQDTKKKSKKSEINFTTALNNASVIKIDLIDYTPPSLALNKNTADSVVASFKETVTEFQQVLTFLQRMKEVQGAVLYICYRVHGVGFLGDIAKESLNENGSIDQFCRNTMKHTARSVKSGLVLLILNYLVHSDEDLNTAVLKIDCNLNQKDMAKVFTYLQENYFKDKDWTGVDYLQNFLGMLKHMKDVYKKKIDRVQ